MRIAVLEIARWPRAAPPASRRSVQIGPSGALNLLLITLPWPPSHAQSVAIVAVALDREHRIDAVRLAQQEIVLAMIRRHMDEAGAGVGGDEIAGQERAGLGEEAAEMVHRVAGDGAGEVGAFDQHRQSMTLVRSRAMRSPLEHVSS